MEKELVEFLHTVTRYFKGKKGVNPNKNNLENNPPFWYFQPKLLHFFNWPSPPISDTNIPISLIHWIILGLLILVTIGIGMHIERNLCHKTKRSN